MTTFNQFKATFAKKVKCEVTWDYLGGFFFILLGLTLTILIEFNIVKHSGTKTFHYTGFSLMVVTGLTVLYWIKIRYRISSFDKDCTDDQIERGIQIMKEKYKMDILKSEGTFCSFFFKPGSMTPGTEINLFYDTDKIYINARPISKGNVDFGYGKTLERKLVTEIKTSR